MLSIITNGIKIPIITNPDNFANASPSILLFENDKTMSVPVKLSILVNKEIIIVVNIFQEVIEKSETIITEIIKAISKGKINLENKYPFFPSGVIHK